MKIIVEGCDGSGKTTLINKIKESMPFMNHKKLSYKNVK